MSTNHKATTEAAKRKRKLDETSNEGISSRHKKVRKTGEPSKEAKEDPEYTKRPGTAGISGQLYETKLLTLVFLRAHLAHKEEKISNFFLGTNLNGVGALDDLILSYEMEGRRKMLFVQAKHRDDASKRKITWNDICSEKGDFSILKYFDSYLEIISKFNGTNPNPIFRTDVKNMEMNLIVYTPAEFEEKFLEKLETDDNDFLKTSDKGKIFQTNFNCLNSDKIERFVELAFKHQMKQLAARLAKFIFPEENLYECMMEDYMIRIYHVVLAKDVIDVTKRPQGDYAEGKIRSDFHWWPSDFIIILRNELYKAAIASRKTEPSNLDTVEQLLKEISKDPNSENFSQLLLLLGSILKFEKNGKLTVANEAKRKINTEMQKSIENLPIKYVGIALKKAGKKILNTITFKLPLSFGNRDLQATDEIEQLAEELADSMINCKDENVVKIVKIHSITTPLQNEKLGNNSDLGRLIGNVLIYDVKTNLLKFNKKQALCENARKFLKVVQIKINDDDRIKLENYRFNIEIKNLPVGSFQLAKNVFCKDLVRDFLNKFKFYVSQPKEDEVEKITKNKLGNCQVFSSNQNLPIKNEDIYTVLHEKILKWWKQPNGYYLTENSEIPNDTRKSIDPQCPYLFVSNSSYLSKVKFVEIKFNEKSVETLNLEVCKFIRNSNQRYLKVITNVTELTAIKLLQYFEKGEAQNEYYFIDYDYVLKRGWFIGIMNEISTKEGIILVVDCGNLRDISLVSGLKKVIFLTCKESKKMSKNEIFKNYHEIVDIKIDFLNLNSDSQNKLLKESRVIFQGRELPLGRVVDDDAKSFISGEILFKLLNGDRVDIDKEVADLDAAIEPYYLKRRIQLQENRESSISEDDFIHYGVRGDGHKVIVISAEPGMGKSTVLTHMALLLKKKRSFPLLWLVRINLNDHFKSLRDLKFSGENDDPDDIQKATDFLLKTLNFKTEFETKLFKRNLRPNSKVKVILFIDGFDEISPNYGGQTQRLLDIIKNAKAAKILVTTRLYSFVDELKTKLNAELLGLEGLDDSDQLNYLGRFWKGTLENEQHAEKFISILEEHLEDDFLDNPLHLRLVAEYYKDEFERFCTSTDEDKYEANFENKINRTTLYEKIIERKYYEIFVDEKKRVDRSNVTVKSAEDKLFKEFLHEHQTLALHSLLNEREFWKITSREIDQQKLEELLKQYGSGERKSGIISTVIEGRARFIRKTFAEYFAGIYFANKFMLMDLEDLKEIDFFVHFKSENEEIFNFFSEAIMEKKPFSDMEEKCAYLLSHYGRAAIIRGIELYPRKFTSSLASYLEKSFQSNGSEYFRKVFRNFDDNGKFVLLAFAHRFERMQFFEFLLKEIDMGVILRVCDRHPNALQKSIKLHDMNDIFSSSSLEFRIWKAVQYDPSDFYVYLKVGGWVISLMEFLKCRRINFDYESAWNIITKRFLDDMWANRCGFGEKPVRMPREFKWKWKIYYKALVIRNLDLNELTNLRIHPDKAENLRTSLSVWELIENDSELSKEKDLREAFFKCRDLFDHLKNKHNENFITLFNELKPNYLGVVINVRDKDGFALIDRAVELGNEEIFNLLKDSKAKCNFNEDEVEEYLSDVKTWKLTGKDSELSRQNDLRDVFFKCRDLFDHLENKRNENFITLFNELKPNYLGVVTNVRNDFGETLIDWAVELKNEEIVNLLKDSGAKCYSERSGILRKFFKISHDYMK